MVATADGFEIVFGGRSERAKIAAANVGATRLQLLDYDNDGWLDLIASGPTLRASAESRARRISRRRPRPLGLDRIAGPVELIHRGADFDDDGDSDLLVNTGENRALRASPE